MNRPSQTGYHALRWLRYAATLLVGTGLFGNHRFAVAQTASTQPNDLHDCARCHACPSPTTEDLCLLPCALLANEKIERSLRQRRGPDVVILDELEDRYLPVPFDHKGHAEMAEVTRGCVVCHHYTPESAAHPACKTCHETASNRQDIRKPGLKGAYHRQCLNCHREWSHKENCSICHLPKTRKDPAGGPTQLLTKDDIVGRMHPPIPEPETEIYTTGAASAPGQSVVFRHKEHVHRFGLACAECHHEDNCMRCHEERNEHAQRTKSVSEHHQPCAACHQVDDQQVCDRCHWKHGQPQPPPFDHATTGWPLGRYHSELGCRGCHISVPFAGLNGTCDSCHSAWSLKTFDHKVTGQVLDKNHAKAPCAECHQERQFERPPTCDECHDEEEGIEFPGRRPGPLGSIEPAETSIPVQEAKQ